MTNLEKAQALELKKQGLSLQQIADELGVGKTTVHNLITASNNVKSNQSEASTGESEKIEALQKELANIRKDFSKNDNRNSEAFQKVELKKLELKHEYRMEKLEMERQEIHLKKKIDELNSEALSFKEDFESLRDQISQLADRNSDLESRIESQDERNSELQSETDMTIDNDIVEDSHVIKFPQIFTDRIKDLLDEYLQIDGTDCTFDAIEAINNELIDIISDITDWADGEGFNLKGHEEMDIINQFKGDLDEAFDAFAEEQVEELNLIIDEDWKADMKDWLESVN